MKVLVADDDAASRLVVKTMLRNLGHECTVVEDGASAWRVFAAGAFDVVISDWMMPGMTGLELCQRVRDHAATDGTYTYFILVTAQGRRQDVITGMRSGADDYLVKPLVIEDLEVRLIAAARVTDLHHQLGHQRTELVRLNAELQGLARLDALTGLSNRLAMQEELVSLDARVARHGHRYSVALFDVDRFKAFNDQYGHLAGDQALQSVALALGSRLRTGDLLYRYGGEEFLAVFPDEGLQGAAAAAGRMRTTVEELTVSHERNQPHGVVTLSAGVATVSRERRGTSHEVLKAADEALYRAKEAGRNRIECA